MAHCEACGATLTPDAPTCKVCGRDNTEHFARLGLVDPPEPQPTAEADEPGEPWKAFSPAPRIPAPWKAARPNPERFKPVAGIVIGAAEEEPSGGLVDLEGFDVDQTPTWFYNSVLLISILGFFGAFLYWNSSSPIIGPGWKFWALVVMLGFGLTALIVAFRLGRKEELARRSLEFAKRRRAAAIRMAREAATGVVSASKGIAQSGSHFREGFESDKEPNWIVKFIRWNIRTVVRTVLGFVSLVRWIFGLVLKIWVLVVRIGWALYRGIVEPVLMLAFRIVRWALKVTYRVARWALKVVWRVFYWLMRRFPFKYVTRMLEEPVRFHIEPKVLVTNVVVSDALKAPVKDPIRQKAEPFVAQYRLERETAKAIRLIAQQEEFEQERPTWLTIPTPEERRERANERRRRKAEAKAAEKQAKIDAKEADKEAKRQAKEEIKKAKEEGRLDELKEQQKAEKLAAKQAKLEAKGKAAAAEAKAAKLEAKEAKLKAKEEAKAAKQAEKTANKEDATPGQPTKSKKQQKADAKAAKKQAKKDAKAEKKAAKKDKKSKSGGKADAKEIGDDATPAS